MKKRFLLPLAIAFVLLACNNEESKTETVSKAQTEVDSVYKEIDDIHFKGMGRMGQLNYRQKWTRAFIDSLDKLPGKASAAVISLREKADSLLKDLDYAEYAMNKWMPEFYTHTDTFANDLVRRLEYLKQEKDKSVKITDAIISGIRRADSLLSGK
ncbi:MAG: hypothetical protein ACK4E0_06375 [Chitinophagaceae bacterium]